MASNTLTGNFIPLNSAFTLRFTPITLNDQSFDPSSDADKFQFNIGNNIDNTFLKKSSQGITFNPGGVATSGDFTVSTTGVAVYVHPQEITASGNGADGNYYIALYTWLSGATDPIVHLEKTITIVKQLPLS